MKNSINSFRLLEYKNTDRWLNWAISSYTGLFNPGTPTYSHSEIWWPNEDGLWENGECFTSTMRGDWNGTVIRPAYYVIKYPENWDYCQFDNINPIKYHAAIGLARIAAKQNQGYDKPALLSFFFPVRFGSSKADICSETSERFMYYCGILSNASIPSPRRLAGKLIKKGYAFKSLQENI
jgi:hypothetical protein